MSTLTHRVAAIQVKMFHLQFRWKKIVEDKQLLNSKLLSFKTDREKIKGMNNAVYNAIDMIIMFEYVFQLVNDLFNTNELKDKFNKNTIHILGNIRKITQKWKPVRNKLGGHIDIEIAEEFCKKYNYRGVFLRDDLESDIGILNILLIENAVNSAANKPLGRYLNIKDNGIVQEVKLFVDTLNKDWDTVFGYFGHLIKFMYEIGKKEKMDNTDPKDWNGIVID